jgi:hypothetical protein
MAVVSTLSNRFKHQALKAYFKSETFYIILMDSAFSFDKDAHHSYSDVSANEISDGNGYTVGGQTITGITITEDDTGDKAYMTCTDPQWTASGGSIGPIGAACIYREVSGSPSRDTIVGAIDLGEDLTIGDGIKYKIEDIQLNLT